jgi:L-lactate dehydrogenase complex protein LldF
VEKAPELPFASSLCGACKDVCPVKIDFPKVLLELRRRVVEGEDKDRRGGEAGVLERLLVRLWRLSMESKTAYGLLSTLSYFLQLPWLSKNGKLNSLPYPFSKWTNDRDFPAVAKTPFRKKWKEINKA